jgi:hypothetical protein
MPTMHFTKEEEKDNKINILFCFCIAPNSRSIQIRIKEYNIHIRLAQTDKSAVAVHSINHGHIIKLEDTNFVLLKLVTWND